MLTIITGGSGSGKSAYGEDYICSMAGENKKYYIATMKRGDDETNDRIKRHRAMRSGKGFETVEQPVDIEDIFLSHDIAPDEYALLECMSNLVANEMFRDGNVYDEAFVFKKVMDGMEKLVNRFKHLVIVTNNIFEDGAEYDEYSMSYIRALGNINRSLAAMADEVTEVVVGIPIKIKEKSLDHNDN